MNNTHRYVLDIFRMTTHNGPGIRTLVQFKGCPLRCIWCSTPESRKAEPELAFYRAKCIQCGSCLTICEANAINIINMQVSLDRSLCNNCGKCAQICGSEAMKFLGRAMSAEELLEEVRKDEIFYRYSSGGVTLSGGEPLLYPKFTVKLLHLLKDEGINVGFDTCGYAPWDSLEPLMPFIDFFLWDIKHMNPDEHLKLTGVSNELILSNLRSVSEKGKPVYIRLPVIPGCNDSEDNIRAVCKFAQELPSLMEIDLLPLHHLGKARYESLGLSYPLPNYLSVSSKMLENIRKIVQSYGITCNIVN